MKSVLVDFSCLPTLYSPDTTRDEEILKEIALEGGLPCLIVYPLLMDCRQKGAGPCDHHTEKR